MPTLTIGNRQVTVGDEFLKLTPEQQSATVEEIAASLPTSVDLPDIAKSGGVGLAKGVMGLAGLSGDARELMAKGVNTLTLGGISPETASGALKHFPAGLLAGPTSDKIRSKVEEVTGPMYEPQTVPGQFAQTVGEFVPAALAGPGSFGRKLVTQAVLPGIASEAAGQATKGTAYEPVARIGGAVLGGSISPRSQRAITSAEHKDYGRGFYKSPAVTDLELAPAGMANLADDVTRQIQTKAGARPYLHKPVYDTLDELRNLSNKGSNVSVEDIKGLRTVLGNVVKENTDNLTGELNSTANAAREARSALNNYLGKIPAADVIKGDAAEASRLLAEGTASWGAGKRASIIEALANRAELNRGAANSGQNLNAERQQLKSLLLSSRKTANFSPEEAAQARRAVLGTKTGNAARFVANALAPSGAMLLQNTAAAGGIAAGGAQLLGYDPATVGIVAAALSQGVGRGARQISKSSTKRQVAKFEKLVSSRSPLAKDAKELARLGIIQPRHIPVVQALLAGRE
jgi:hypothetical protein